MNLTKLKRVAVLRAGGTPSVQVERFWREPPDGVPWVAIGDMSDGGLVRNTVRHVSSDGITVKRLPIGRPGTVLFAMYASLGAVAELAVTASWNQALLGIEPVPGVSDRRFIRYWLEHLRPSLGALARSNTQDNLNAEQVANLDFPILSVEAQQAIANYLDTETNRIDTLITKNTALIELLEERMLYAARALTTSCGDVAPLRRVARTVKTGTTPPARELDLLLGDEVAWYSPADVGPYLRMLSPKRSLLRKSLSAGWVPAFQADATLIVGIGTVGRVGHTSALSTANQQMTCIASNSLVIPRFLSWQLWAREDELRETAPYTTLPIINNDFLREIPIYIPPMDQQRSVVSRLDREADQVIAASRGLREQIDLLTERRQTLITTAVTGELTVPVDQS